MKSLPLTIIIACKMCESTFLRNKTVLLSRQSDFGSIDSQFSWHDLIIKAYLECYAENLHVNKVLFLFPEYVSNDFCSRKQYYRDL